MNLGYLTNHQFGKFQDDYVITGSPGFLISWFHIPVFVDVFVPGITEVWTNAATAGYIYTASEIIDLVILPPEKFVLLNSSFSDNKLDLEFNDLLREYIFILPGNNISTSYSIENFYDYIFTDDKGILMKFDPVSLTWVMVHRDLTFTDLQELEIESTQKVDLEVS